MSSAASRLAWMNACALWTGTLGCENVGRPAYTAASWASKLAATAADEKPAHAV